MGVIVMMLVPDIRQKTDWDGSYAAATSILLMFNRIAPNTNPAIKQKRQQTNPNNLAEALRSYGLHIQSGEMSQEDLRHHIKQNRPVICLTQYNGTGHYVIVFDVTDYDLGIQCPTQGPIRKSWEDFTKDWWDCIRTENIIESYNQFGIAVWET